MPSNKSRLYVALYVRSGPPTMPGGEDKYHWAFIIGPKIEDTESKGWRIHARERISVVEGMPQTVWALEELRITMAPTAMILVRILVSKIENMDRVLAILRGVPVRPEKQGWNCVEWVMEALEALQRDGKALGTSVTEWQTIRDAVMSYVRQKEAEHRFDGKAAFGAFNTRKVATYDLLTKTETIL